MVFSVLITFLRILFEILSIAIIGRVLVSWVNLRPDHPIVIFLHQITEPILGPLRSVIPPMGMIDITPIVALILLRVISALLIPMLSSMA